MTLRSNFATGEGQALAETTSSPATKGSLNFCVRHVGGTILRITRNNQDKSCWDYALLHAFITLPCLLESGRYHGSAPLGLLEMVFCSPAESSQTSTSEHLPIYRSSRSQAPRKMALFLNSLVLAITSMHRSSTHAAWRRLSTSSCPGLPLLYPLVLPVSRSLPMSRMLILLLPRSKSCQHARAKSNPLKLVREAARLPTNFAQCYCPCS